MVLNVRDAERHGYPLSFLDPGQVHVRCGPNSVTGLDADRIPLDGRHYVCAGEVILQDGRRLRANFEVATHTFAFLQRDSLKCTLDGEDWYGLDDPAFLKLLGLKKKDVAVFDWQSDRPLNYHEPGPYPMDYPYHELR